MKKIPNLFKRNYETGLIYDEIVEGSEWVQSGEGVATQKFDGTACAIINNKFYKRYDAKIDRVTGKYKKPIPKGAISCQEPDFITGHHPHWIATNPFNPTDKYYYEAFISKWEDGTYELCGEKVQSNPEKITGHKLIKHGNVILKNIPTDFEGLKKWLSNCNIEGIVWHHSDGRMVKIKCTDFGLKRKL